MKLIPVHYICQGKQQFLGFFYPELLSSDESKRVTFIRKKRGGAIVKAVFTDKNEPKPLTNHATEVERFPSSASAVEPEYGTDSTVLPVRNYNTVATGIAAAQSRWAAERGRSERRAPGSHTMDEWEALLERHGHACVCCGAAGVELTRDHVEPLEDGGSNTIYNIQPLCRVCNSRKGKRSVDYRHG